VSCKVTFEFIIKFRDYDLLLNLDTSSINVEFYSLSNSFYFIILCYIEQKIYFFCGGLQFQDLNAQKFPTNRGILAFQSQYVKG